MLHNTTCIRFVPPSHAICSVVLSRIVATNVWRLDSSGPVAAFSLSVPLTALGNSLVNRLVKILSCACLYNVGGQTDFVSFDTAFHIVTPGVNGALPVATVYANTYDAAGTTARHLIGAHSLVSTPSPTALPWLSSDNCQLVITADPGATTEFAFYGAWFTYTLRI